MPSEYRIVGPPGTGKTSTLALQIEHWAAEHPPERMVLTSYTRAAASVLAGRIKVPRENIATLHALCYRALGRPPIAETGKLAALWDDQPKLPPGWRLNNRAPTDPEEEVLADAEAGTMLADYNLWRAQLRTDPLLGERVRYFAQAWEDFKAQTGSVDFADMLEFGQRELYECPGSPEVLVVDEAQDLTPAQWQLVRQWGTAPSLQRYVVAGDPAQTIYTFVGASPEAFMQPVEPGHERQLGQSWRLPPAVHAFAEDYLHRHSPLLWGGRSYRPREDAAGEVRGSMATWRFPDPLLPEIQACLEAGQTVMLLALCSFQLVPTIAMLRREGIPFANPYRRMNGAWNPLRAARDDEVSTTRRLLDYLRPDPKTWGEEARSWTPAEAIRWLEMLPAQEFEGTKSKLLAEVHALGREVLPADLIGVLTDDALEALLAEPNPDGLAARVLQRFLSPLQFAVAIHRHSGARSLQEEPKVVVGTVHSVKGGEADCVMLFPDLSHAGYRESKTAQGRDAVIRQGYVGMTRARRDLVLCASASAKQSVMEV